MKYILASSFLAVAALSSCEQEYEAMDTVSDVSFYTSLTYSQGNEFLVVSVDTVISFMDASQGALSHKWIIEDGAQFMVNDFNLKGGLQNQIDSKKGLISTQKVESVYFSKPGNTTVRLSNTFGEWVTSHDTKPVQAEWNGSTWTFDKVFNIDVYGKLKPAVAVYDMQGNLIFQMDENYVVNDDISTWDTIYVNVGDKLQFEDLTTGDRPDGRTWNIAGRSDTARVFAPTFNVVKDGGYTNLALTETRKLPVASVRKAIPLVLMVKPVYTDVTFDQVRVSDDMESIYLSSSTTKFAAVSDTLCRSFAIEVTDATGASVSNSVVHVDLSEDKSTLELVLSKALEDQSVVKLDYNGKGNLNTTTYKTVNPFHAEVTAEVSLIPVEVKGASVSSKYVVNLSMPASVVKLAATVVSDFSLQMVSEAGNAIGANITNVAVSDDASALSLTLSEQIYEGDKIMVSYTNNKGVILEGSKVLNTFSDLVVDNSLDQSLLPETIFSFDDNVSGNWWKPATQSSYIVLVSDPDDASNYVMKFDNSTNGLSGVAAYFTTYGSKNPLSVACNGTYRFALDIKTSQPVADLEVQLLYKGNSAYSEPNAKTATVSTSSTEWKTVYCDFSLTETLTGLRVKFDKNIPDGVVVYVDNLRWVPLRNN